MQLFPRTPRINESFRQLLSSLEEGGPSYLFLQHMGGLAAQQNLETPKLRQDPDALSNQRAPHEITFWEVPNPDKGVILRYYPGSSTMSVQIGSRAVAHVDWAEKLRNEGSTGIANTYPDGWIEQVTYSSGASVLQRLPESQALRFGQLYHVPCPAELLS